MTVLQSSTFTGSNGAAWGSEWALGRNPATGGGATIQSNTGRLQTGTTAGYVFGDRIARRVAGAAVADQDVTFRFSHDGTECYPELWLRSTNPELDGGTGYTIGIDLGGGQITLRRQIASVTTTLGSPIAKAMTSGVWYRLRAQTIGTALKLRVWNDGDTEPTTWNVSVTDANITAAGYSGWSVGGGGGSTASNFFVDDFEQTDAAVTAPPPTTPSGFTGWGVPAKVITGTTPSYTVTAPAPTVTMAGTTASVSVTVTVTGGPVLFDTLQVQLTNTAGGTTTVGTLSDTSVATTQALTGSVSLAVGTYTARVAYTLDGTNWVYLTSGTFTVSSGTTPPPTGTGTWLSGSSGDDYLALGTARGRPIEIGGTWAHETWAAIGPGTIWANWTKPIDITLQELVKPGETWAAHAGRSFVARYDQALNNLKAALGSRPQSMLYIRPHHEFNGDWYPWMVRGTDAANFVAAWRIFHERKQLILPGAKMVWSPGNGTAGANALDVRTAWPGSAYVDVLGVDYYNGWPGVNDQAAWDARLIQKDGFGAPIGLGAWLDQARLWGVPMALSEWGGHKTEGGDFPNFFTYLYGWMKTNGGTGAGKFLYEVYFNIGPDFMLYPTTTMPLSWTAYRALWSTGVVEPPPVDPEDPPPPTAGGVWNGKTRTISMWDMSFQPAPLLREYPADVKAAIDLLVLGLAQHAQAGTGFMTYTKQGQSVADHAADIADFKSRGIKVVMGFGGGGASISITNETQVTQAMSSITGFVNTYGIQGIDCDIEPSGASWSQSALVSLFTQCKAKWGPNFIIGVTPGLWGEHTAKWFNLVQALGPNRYDDFAPMEYDYPQSQTTAGLAPIWAYKIQWMVDAGIPANKIIMGCMMQPFAGYSATINAQTILDCWNQEVAKRSTLRGYFEWESRIARARNWDLIRKMQPTGQFNT